MTSLTVVSAHLDDALLSVGGLLAQHPGSIVVTVLAGEPDTDELTPFDAKCGFTSSIDAVLTRREEDRAALNELRCGAVHLPYLDGQYGPDYARSGLIGFNAMTRELAAVMDDEEQVVLVPLGLTHPDHELVAAACRYAAAIVNRECLTVYADLPNARLWPGDRRPAQKLWAQAGWQFGRTPWVPDLDAKRRALAHYGSQMGLPELVFENLVEERGWRITRND